MTSKHKILITYPSSLYSLSKLFPKIEAKIRRRESCSSKIQPLYEGIIDSTYVRAILVPEMLIDTFQETYHQYSSLFEILVDT